VEESAVAVTALTGIEMVDVFSIWTEAVDVTVAGVVVMVTTEVDVVVTGAAVVVVVALRSAVGVEISFLLGLSTGGSTLLLLLLPVAAATGSEAAGVDVPASGAPDEAESAGRPVCCDSSFTLLCTDFRRLGVAELGDGSGLDRLEHRKIVKNVQIWKSWTICYLRGAGLFWRSGELRSCSRYSSKMALTRNTVISSSWAFCGGLAAPAAPAAPAAAGTAGDTAAEELETAGAVDLLGLLPPLAAPGLTAGLLLLLVCLLPRADLVGVASDFVAVVDVLAVDAGGVVAATLPAVLLALLSLVLLLLLLPLGAGIVSAGAEEALEALLPATMAGSTTIRVGGLLLSLAATITDVTVVRDVAVVAVTTALVDSVACDGGRTFGSSSVGSSLISRSSGAGWRLLVLLPLLMTLLLLLLLLLHFSSSARAWRAAEATVNSCMSGASVDSGWVCPESALLVSGSSVECGEQQAALLLPVADSAEAAPTLTGEAAETSMEPE
jgi:hypothetical protein